MQSRESAVAVVSESGDVSYGTLATQAAQIAGEVSELGLPARSIVALLFDPGADYVASVLGILGAGHVFMPVNPGFPTRRIAEMLTEAQVPACVVSGRHRLRERELLDALGGQFVRQFDVNARDGAPASLLRFPRNNGHPSRSPLNQVSSNRDDACYVMATSGSTGKPKIILGSQRGLEHFIDWEIGRFGFKEGGRCSFLSHVSFDVSLRDIFAPLLSGGSVCIPDEATRLTPARLWNWLGDLGISHVHIVPTLLRGLVAGLGERSESSTQRLGSLRYAIIAGEPLYRSDVERWQTRVNETTRLVNLYGPSETTLAKFFYEVDGDSLPANGMIPVGYPLPDTDLLLLNDQGLPATEGEVGEVCIATSYMSLGYLNATEEQSRCFVKLPWRGEASTSVYRTGDLGRIMVSGELQLVGRKDNQIKLYGNRIELAEVDAAMCEHPDVAQAASVVKTDRADNQRLIGYFVPIPGKAPQPKQLRDLLAQSVPDYMIPALFVRIEALPLTHSNKVDRAALPSPPRSRPELERDFEPPETDIERSLSEVWRKVLDIDEVGVEDGFFELGGTSMLALHLVAVIKEDMGFEVPVTSVFQHPTVRQMARLFVVEDQDDQMHALTDDRANRRLYAMRRRRRRGREE